MAAADLAQRHPATQHLMKWLAVNPNLPLEQRAVATVIARAARELLTVLEDGQELSAGLRKLREAKDCFVIQSLEDGAAREGSLTP